MKLESIFTFIILGGLLASVPLCEAEPASGGATAGARAAADGGDAQRVVAMLDYVAGDYGLAVRDGRVIAAAEYAEQVQFAAMLRRLGEGLLAGDEHALRERLLGVERLVEDKASPIAVAAACREARDAVVLRFGLPTQPAGRPDLARARALYEQACAICHGTQGDAATERASRLDPPPASFRDPARLRDLSPYRAYNALTFGVPGTSMAAFEGLSAAERWDLAFYVFRLGHAGEPARAAALPLATHARSTDAEILATLRVEGHTAPEQGLAWLRREGVFRPAEPGEDVGLARQLLREALAGFEAGRPRDAERLALDAYLQGFEPAEPRLRVRDAAGTAAIEAAFHELRQAIASASPAAPGAVQASARRLDERLRLIGTTGSGPALPFFAALIIYLREGIEAALLVAALLAGVRRLGHAGAVRFVHLGWLLALPAGVATWWLTARLIAAGSSQRELVEGTVSLLAAAVLFSVSFWLISKAESRRWSEYLRGRVERGLQGRSLWLLAGLAFLAVYREAAETVLFTQALLLDAESRAGQVWAGAAAGLLLVVGASSLLGRASRRLPLGPFFAVSSLLLCGLAISFAGAGIYELVSAGYLAPRPVAIPEVPWLGIHADLTGVLVQLTIVSVIAAAGVASLRRSGGEASPALARRRDGR